MVTNELCVVISALAFIFGGCLGFFICALMSANGDDDDDIEMQKEAYRLIVSRLRYAECSKGGDNNAR